MSSENRMSDGPLVTFVLFSYNQENYIHEAVKGAFCQTYEPLEIILSDDCSTDRTYEIIQEMTDAYKGPHKIKVRQCSKNRGFANHINEIIEVVSGEIVAWAAGDDVSLPERVNLLVQPIIDDASVIGTHSAVREINLDGSPLKLRACGKQTSSPPLMDVITGAFSIVSQSHVFQRKVFSVFGPFREDLSNEGPAMAFREALLGQVVYLPKETVLYRVGSGISTYSGRDLYKTKITEPVKITKWSLTSRLQMLDDLNTYGGVQSNLLRIELLKQIEFYKALLEINEKPRAVIALMQNLLRKPTDFRSLRAFIRRNSPDLLWGARVMLTRFCRTK